MLIVANWKDYVETLEKAKRLYAAGKRLAATGKHDIVLAPPAPYLGLIAVGNRSNIEFSAQDISEVEGGAATGEVTAGIVKSTGVSYVIVGHSERRAKGDTDDIVLAKVRQALKKDLTPIVCVGESVRDTDAHYLAFLRKQIGAVLAPLSPADRKKIVIAYEPIWAIGKSAAESITPEDLSEMILYIRKVLTEYFPGKGNAKVALLYGGSVEPGNVRMLAQTGIDGFLIGHASADTTMFGTLVKALP